MRPIFLLHFPEDPAGDALRRKYPQSKSADGRQITQRLSPVPHADSAAQGCWSVRWQTPHSGRSAVGIRASCRRPQSKRQPSAQQPTAMLYRYAGQACLLVKYPVSRRSIAETVRKLRTEAACLCPQLFRCPCPSGSKIYLTITADGAFGSPPVSFIKPVFPGRRGFRTVPMDSMFPVKSGEHCQCVLEKNDLPRRQMHSFLPIPESTMTPS